MGQVLFHSDPRPFSTSVVPPQSLYVHEPTFAMQAICCPLFFVTVNLSLGLLFNALVMASVKFNVIVFPSSASVMATLLS